MHLKRNAFHTENSSGLSVVTVIGIDPGSRLMGWGIVSDRSGVLRLEGCGVIRGAQGADKSFSARLAHIYAELNEVIRQYKPAEAAIEQVFTAHNAATALKLGQARGVAVAACAAYGIGVSDYPPTLVKKTLVGTGSAAKEQVSFMIRRLLNLRDEQWDPRWTLDTSDALGIAICHLTMRRFAALQASH